MPRTGDRNSQPNPFRPSLPISLGHQAKARELFHADPCISHFTYLEDDIRITKANLIWWLQARKQLQKHGLYPGLLRYEVHPNTKERYSSNVIAPASHENTSKLVFKDGGYAFLNLNDPYQGLALMDRELMEEYLQMLAAEINKTNWGIRKRRIKVSPFGMGRPASNAAPWWATR